LAEGYILPQAYKILNLTASAANLFTVDSRRVVPAR